jgi:hypothetical protein
MMKTLFFLTAGTFLLLPSIPQSARPINLLRNSQLARCDQIYRYKWQANLKDAQGYDAQGYDAQGNKEYQSIAAARNEVSPTSLTGKSSPNRIGPPRAVHRHNDRFRWYCLFEFRLGLHG